MAKKDSPEKLTLALARLGSDIAYGRTIRSKAEAKLMKLIDRAKVLAKDIRKEIRKYWRPSENRLCMCGHPFNEHGLANCDHEVGGVCMRHTCAKACNHRSKSANVSRRRPYPGTCKCKVFRERPGNKVKP